MKTAISAIADARAFTLSILRTATEQGASTKNSDYQDKALVPKDTGDRP
jgi:hypothetical protein